MIFVDAHNHLHDARLSLVGVATLIAECASVGVARFVVNGTNPEDWQAVKDISQRHSEVIPSFGVHPWFLDKLSPSWRDDLRRYLDTTPGAVGEIGLDSWRKPVNVRLQEAVFKEQIVLAADRNVPASIHGLRAWERVYSCLKQSPLPTCGVLLHSYGGPIELVKPFVKLGAYFSCPGFFLRRGNERKLDLFKEIPLERILVETDAPDQCLPEELDRYGWRDESSERRRINHPANLVVVYERLALLRGVSLGEFADQIHVNFVRLFRSF